MGTVYLIHFDEPYKHARHYVGYAEHVAKRLKHHQAGTGARLMQVLKEQGIGWKMVRTWKKVDRHFERKLKNRNNTPRLCPICNTGEKNIRASKVKT